MRCFQRIARPGLVVLLLATLGSCGARERQGPPPLDEAELRLVEETLRMIRIRLVATRDSAAAAALRAENDDLYTDEEREFLLERLARDSARGEAVMDALHDSLEAMRTELFPPTQGGQP